MPATLSPDDLKSAVEAGVIDAAQAEKLKAMSAAPNASAPAYADAPLADEERFRFLNGFNDVFLTIGVLLIAALPSPPAFVMLAAAYLLGFERDPRPSIARSATRNGAVVVVRRNDSHNLSILLVWHTNTLGHLFRVCVLDEILRSTSAYRRLSLL